MNTVQAPGRRGQRRGQQRGPDGGGDRVAEDDGGGGLYTLHPVHPYISLKPFYLSSDTVLPIK